MKRAPRFGMFEGVKPENVRQRMTKGEGQKVKGLLTKRSHCHQNCLFLGRRAMTLQLPRVFRPWFPKLRPSVAQCHQGCCTLTPRTTYLTRGYAAMQPSLPVRAREEVKPIWISGCKCRLEVLVADSKGVREGVVVRQVVTCEI